MKPGLRKVAALILATATLFGSGASAVSAAYADDTTMGTSTRIQAEPGKTTTGGDEAATKPDAGSGDEAGTGADEQSGTGAPAQSAPQADAGQAAPDVTIHDMLDTDSAAVSRLRLTDRITGTAPFDKDNERGDDKDETNDIVRSYDTVTYDYEYTLTPDSTMDYYRRTRVGFRFELPYPADKVTFDAEKMGWVDHTPGYEPKLTTETIDGIVTQVYTCYRLLEPTSQSPTVNPGTGSIGLSVAVKGAPHGYRFHPTVKAWPAWDASNPTNTGVTANPDPSPSVSYSPTSLLPCSYHSHMCSVNDPSSCSSYMTVSSSAILELDVLGERGGRVVFVFDPPCRVVHPQHLPAQFGERVTVLDARVAGEHVDLAEGAASYRLRPVALGFRAPQFAEPVKPVALPGRDADAGGA